MFGQRPLRRPPALFRALTGRRTPMERSVATKRRALAIWATCLMALVHPDARAAADKPLTFLVTEIVVDSAIESLDSASAADILTRRFGRLDGGRKITVRSFSEVKATLDRVAFAEMVAATAMTTSTAWVSTSMLIASFLAASLVSGTF